MLLELKKRSLDNVIKATQQQNSLHMLQERFHAEFENALNAESLAE
jgi:hypothetical protein